MARNIISADTTIGKRLSTALKYSWTETERTVLLEEPESFDAKLIQEDREEAKREAKRERPVFVMFTDGSRLENEAAGYAVAWKTGQTWEGIKTHMVFNQEAFNAECAALARALETAARRDPAPDHITIFTNVQAAIRGMASDKPGPGQKYALEAREHIAVLRRAVPDITIEVRWCPAHEGVEGNEKADEWAKLAADEPDTPGVEWLDGACSLPLPRSLTNIGREISEKKWTEAREWAGGRATTKKYKMPKGQRPDSTVAGSTKRLALRFYQLKTGYCHTGEYLHWTTFRSTPQCWWCLHPRQRREHLLKGCQKWRKQQRVLWKEVWKETGKGRGRLKAHELFAEPGASQEILDFLATMDVGKTVPAVEVEADEEAGSEVSEGELRERAEQEEERRAEELGTENEGEEEHGLFLPTPAFMASAESE